MYDFKVILQEKIFELFKINTIITILTLIALIAILALIRRKGGFSTKMLTYGAISIACAFVLSYVKLFQMPYGGTVTAASMLPLFVFAFIAGPRAGVVAGLCYSMLQFIQEPFFVHPVQFILDYPLAFGVLGLAGVFKSNVYIGAVFGGFLRLTSHFLSGVIFFGSYAAPGQSVYEYSLLYNAFYMLPEIVICLGLLAVPNLRSAVQRIKLAGN